MTDQVVNPQIDLHTHKIYKAMRKRLELKVNYHINVEICLCLYLLKLQFLLQLE